MLNNHVLHHNIRGKTSHLLAVIVLCLQFMKRSKEHIVIFHSGALSMTHTLKKCKNEYHASCDESCETELVSGESGQNISCNVHHNTSASAPSQVSTATTKHRLTNRPSKQQLKYSPDIYTNSACQCCISHKCHIFTAVNRCKQTHS